MADFDGVPKASFRQMFWFIWLLTLGPGVLSVPYHVHRVGQLSLALMNIYVGFTYIWSMLALKQVKDWIEGKGVEVITYQELGEEVIGGAAGRRIVEFFIFGLQFGLLAAKYSTVAMLLEVMVPGVGLDQTDWTYLLMPLFIVLSCSQFLKDLGDFSNVCSYLFLTAWVALLTWSCTRIERRSYNTSLFPGQNSEWGLVGFYGTIVYLWEGLPSAFVQIANVLDEPHRLKELIFSAAAVILCVVYGTGLICSLAFKKPPSIVSQALLDEYGLTAGPLLINGAFVFTQVVRYPLQFYPMISLIERNLGIGPGARLDAIGKPTEASKLVDDEAGGDAKKAFSYFIPVDTPDGAQAVLLRTALVVLTGAFTLLIPELTDIINIIGVAFGSVIGIALPCLFDVVAYSRSGKNKNPVYERSKTAVAVSSSVFLATTLAAVFGTAHLSWHNFAH